MGMITKTTSIDHYITGFPAAIQKRLQQMRQTIKKAAPLATETISYGIPTFKLNGNLVHFGAFKSHISLFPTAAGIEAIKDEHSSYTISKGTIQFPLTEPLPIPLISKIVKYRVKQSLSRASAKSSGKK